MSAGDLKRKIYEIIVARIEGYLVEDCDFDRGGIMRLATDILKTVEADDISLEDELRGTETWLELRELLTSEIATIRDWEHDPDRASRLEKFMSEHWSLQAPRQDEITALRRKIYDQRKKIDELIALLKIPTKEKSRT